MVYCNQLIYKMQANNAFEQSLTNKINNMYKKRCSELNEKSLQNYLKNEKMQKLKEEINQNFEEWIDSRSSLNFENLKNFNWQLVLVDPSYIPNDEEIETAIRVDGINMYTYDTYEEEMRHIWNTPFIELTTSKDFGFKEIFYSFFPIRCSFKTKKVLVVTFLDPDNPEKWDKLAEQFVKTKNNV